MSGAGPAGWLPWRSDSWPQQWHAYLQAPRPMPAGDEIRGCLVSRQMPHGREALTTTGLQVRRFPIPLLWAHGRRYQDSGARVTLDALIDPKRVDQARIGWVYGLRKTLDSVEIVAGLDDGPGAHPDALRIAQAARGGCFRRLSAGVQPIQLRQEGELVVYDEYELLEVSLCTEGRDPGALFRLFDAAGRPVDVQMRSTAL